MIRIYKKKSRVGRQKSVDWKTLVDGIKKMEEANLPGSCQADKTIHLDLGSVSQSLLNAKFISCTLAFCHGP